MLEAFNYVQAQERLDNFPPPPMDPGRDYGCLDDNGDGVANTADGAVADTVFFGPYSGDSLFFGCSVFSNVNGMVFSSHDVLFNVTVSNAGSVSLTGATLVLSFGDVEGEEFFVIDEQTYPVSVSPGQSIDIPVSWQASSNGVFYVRIDLYKGGTYYDYVIYSFEVSGGGDNQPPSPPTISGQANGKINTAYPYTFIAIDPEGDEVSYYIEWGDAGSTPWTEFQASGSPGYSESYSWSTKGTYIIRAKAKDTYGAESNWAQLTVTMPCTYNKPFQLFWERLFERFPNAFPLLRNLLRY
jgi:hypothetical protein